MIQILDRKECCGCSACASVCPVDAIAMIPDGMGFPYPTVDMDRCIGCGKCEDVCAFRKGFDTSLNLSSPLSYAVRSKKADELAGSQSGAASYLLMKSFVETGGVVYGAGFVDHFRVAHKRADTLETMQEFRLSKYVQSDMGDTFRSVLADLKAGRKVLFTGTPCQTAGLAAYVGTRLRENLTLQDIVCHGVPAPYVWRDYLAFREKKAGKSATAVFFRNPDFGWHQHRETICFGNEKVSIAEYATLFHSTRMLRPCCGVCPYASVQRPADITAGDCWGIEEVDPAFGQDGKGVSLVLVNTEKGKSLLSDIQSGMEMLPVRLSDVLQPNLEHPTPISPESDRFEQDFLHRNFSYIRKKYIQPFLLERYRNLKWCIKQSLRKLLKRK